MIVIGFDPSMCNWGYAVANVTDKVTPIALGVITVTGEGRSTTEQYINHAAKLFAGVIDVLSKYSIKTIIAETPTGSQSFASAKSYALVNGLLGVLTTQGFNVILVKPNDLKNTVGNRTATKVDMVNWVIQKYPNIALPKHNGKVVLSQAEHMCDALIAIHTAINLNLFGKPQS